MPRKCKEFLRYMTKNQSDCTSGKYGLTSPNSYEKRRFYGIMQSIRKWALTLLTIKDADNFVKYSNSCV